MFAVCPIPKKKHVQPFFICSNLSPSQREKCFQSCYSYSHVHFSFHIFRTCFDETSSLIISLRTAIEKKKNFRLFQIGTHKPAQSVYYIVNTLQNMYQWGLFVVYPF